MKQVRIDQAAMSEVKAMLGEFAEKYKTVMVTAINQTLGTAKTQAAARVGNKVNLTAARIKEDFYLEKANFSKISGGLVASDADTSRIGLMSYGAKQTLKGVTVQILRSKPRFLLPHAFIATGRGSTMEHVFWRRTRKAGTGKWPVGQKARAPWSQIKPEYRVPLSRRTGPSVAYWFGKPDVFDPVSIQAQHVYLINVDDKVKEIIRRYA